MTEERQCHACKRILAPEESSTTVEAGGRDVVLCDSCWNKAVMFAGKTAIPGSPQKLLNDLLSPVVGRAINIPQQEDGKISD